MTDTSKIETVGAEGSREESNIIFENGSVTIDHSPDETKIPRFRIQIREPEGNYFFSISESKFFLLVNAILEKSGVKVKGKSQSDLGSLEID